MHIYKIVQTELWGNAKDGFDSNAWHTLQTVYSKKELTDRWLLRLVRNQFEGRGFAWTENHGTYMSRRGIEIANPQCQENMIEVQYRGHYVGEVQIEEVEG